MNQAFFDGYHLTAALYVTVSHCRFSPRFSSRLLMSVSPMTLYGCASSPTLLLKPTDCWITAVFLRRPFFHPQSLSPSSVVCSCLLLFSEGGISGLQTPALAIYFSKLQLLTTIDCHACPPPQEMSLQLGQVIPCFQTTRPYAKSEYPNTMFKHHRPSLPMA